jgi:Protein of unknown function (DUF3131)
MLQGGLSMGLAAGLSGCGALVRSSATAIEEFRNSEIWYQGRHGALTEEEQVFAKTAWAYFVNNHNAGTGLVNSVDKYPSTTMWHIGDYLAALMIAFEFKIIGKKEFDERLSALLEFLNKLRLAAGRLPNKAYHTHTGEMVGYDNKPAEVGWSAIDIGRLLIWLKIVASRYSHFTEYVEKIIIRWDYCGLIGDDGTLYGSAKSQQGLKIYMEVGPGYVEYARQGYRMWGFEALRKPDFDIRHGVEVEGVELNYDSAGARELGSRAPLVTAPYALYGMEFNWDLLTQYTNLDSRHTDREIADLAERIYRVQESRFMNKRILTARTDHQLGQAPFYVYDSIYAAGYPWNTISDSGEFFPKFALVSTRAAFGMWALWKTPYTAHLIKSVSELYDPKRGWYEGRYEVTGAYEKTISCSTNAFILQALAHKCFGKLYTLGEPTTYRSILLSNYFENPGRCNPGDSIQPVKRAS